MNISKDGWVAWALKDPGPADRWANFGSAKVPVDAIYHHSYQGVFNPVSEGGYNPMSDPARFPTAWQFTVTNHDVKFKGMVLKAPQLFQHYPLNARLQHSNGGNVIGPAIERDGYNTEPLAEKQMDLYLALHRDISEWTGKSYVRTGDWRIGLVEHREVTGSQTACPGNLYNPLWERIRQGESPMTPAERKEFDALKAIVDRIDKKSVVLGPDLAGYDLLASLRKQSDEINAHLKGHSPTGGKVTGTFTGVIS